ncbi:MAG: hypothetical protein RMZ41_021705 [Nostoc sp. DedVER02]
MKSCIFQHSNSHHKSVTIGNQGVGYPDSRFLLMVKLGLIFREYRVEFCL